MLGYKTNEIRVVVITSFTILLAEKGKCFMVVFWENIIGFFRPTNLSKEYCRNDYFYTNFDLFSED